MYIFKNAITSILRNKGRNILIGIIILVISCACAVTLAINNSANSLISAYASKYQVEATIQINREAMMGSFDPTSSTSQTDMKAVYSSIEPITLEQIKTYAKSDYVSSYYYTYSVGLNSETLEAAESTDPGSGKGGDRPGSTSSTEFTISGYNSYEAMSDFIEGSYTITDGEVSSDFTGNNCVINSELATLNNIKVGDTITLTNPNDSTKTYTLTVTGIFEDTSTTSGFSMFTNSVNTIITNTTVVENVLSTDSTLTGTLSPTFILKNSDSVDAFQSELYSLGMNEYYAVNTNLDEVESATSGISNVSTFATTFLIITLIIGGVVLLIVNMINIKERKYEIGVLRTIGMKKSLLTFQFMTELMVVSVVFLLVGAGIGAAISVPVSNALLSSEISSSSESADNIDSNFGKGPGSSDTSSSDTSSSSTKPSGTVPSGNMGKTVAQAYDSIDAVVDFKVLLELLGIGIALTLISSSVSMISIQKFSPLTILKERS